MAYEVGDGQSSLVISTFVDAADTKDGKKGQSSLVISTFVDQVLDCIPS